MRQSIINTVEWRESSGLWNLVTDRSKRKKLLGVLGEGMLVAAAEPDAYGCCAIVVNLGFVANVTGAGDFLSSCLFLTSYFVCHRIVNRQSPEFVLYLDLKRIPDLMLYTLERAELVAKRAGYEGGMVKLFVNAQDCPMALLKRYIQNVSLWRLTCELVGGLALKTRRP